jgi:uncharacterized protein (TIGR03083 family)
VSDDLTPRTHASDLLRSVWSDLDSLVSELAPEQWSVSVLPGWDVKDTIAHIIGTEKMLVKGTDDMRFRVTAAAQAGVPGSDRPHVRNAIGMSNEEWVQHFKSSSPDEVLAELRDITAQRLAFLAQMSDEEFASPSWTPAGEGTYSSFMRIRLFDCWMHDQDIRHAIGEPGNESGPVAEESLEEVVGALGYVVGKRGQAPSGSVVTFELTGPIERSLVVEVTERARVVEQASRKPDVVLSLSSALFMRLAGGRISYDDVADQVDVAGDLELGRRIAANLAFTV